MTDLELTKLCAEAMGLTFIAEHKGKQLVYKYPNTAYKFNYHPLHDDAQAMALVKKFRLRLLPNTKTKAWMADLSDDIEGIGPTLNRAICECTAKMQQSKNG